MRTELFRLVKPKKLVSLPGLIHTTVLLLDAKYRAKTSVTPGS